MAAFNKFDSFVEALAHKVHNLGSDVLKVALSNSAPSASNTQLSDISQISYTNCSTRVVTLTSSGQTGGIYRLIIVDLTLTASGTVGPFQYVVLYNDSATNKELIGWWDYSAAVTLASPQTFLLDFNGTAGVVVLS